MATITATSQWLRLRAAKSRRTIQPFIPKRHATFSPTEPNHHSSTPHDNITSFLQAADDHKLAETQHHLRNLESSISRTTSTLLSILTQSEKIQLMPTTIPPYTPSLPRKHLAALLPPTLARLDAHQRRLHANLTDLLSVPHRSSRDPGASGEVLAGTDGVGRMGREGELRALRYDGRSRETRMGLAMGRLEEEVRRFEGLKGKGGRRFVSGEERVRVEEDGVRTASGSAGLVRGGHVRGPGQGRRSGWRGRRRVHSFGNGARRGVL